MDYVAAGASIQIQRSDGRVHSAVISSLNVDTRSVTVEWFENGETKGKEIEVEQILALNPELLSNSKAKLARKIPAPVRNLKNENEVPSMIPSPRKVAKNEEKATEAETNANNKQPGVPFRPPLSRGNSSSNIPASRRRSNCVKEVEKLKKNRDERRARNAELIQNRLDDGDVPSGPNADFLKMIREYRDTLEFDEITMSDPVLDHQICVCVRKRPRNKKEKNKKEIDVITIPDKYTTLVHEPKLKVDLTKYLENQKFRFDYSFNENASNEMVYRYTAQPLIATIFEGGMATCFAYGQTGSGKTHTMGGDFSGKEQDCTKGIYAYTARDVFILNSQSKYQDLSLKICASFFEIYGGKVFDLLRNRKKLQILEDGKQQVQVVGLSEKEVKSTEDVLDLIKIGSGIRTSGTTSANSHSSRSHAVFQIIIRKGKANKLHGKFSLIDLAGNERGADTSSANRQTRMEGAEINKSLLALKECIRALGRKGGYTPFRASKLTQVLRDSFIGENSKTCMIATISPGMSSCEHTLNTLRYADRVKELPSNGPMPQAAALPNILEQNNVQKNNVKDNLTDSKSSDLALLCSQNDDVQGEDHGWLLTFHETVTQLQEAEEQLIEAHRAYLQKEKSIIDIEDRMLHEVDTNVEYDIDEYSKNLDTVLSEQMKSIAELREKLFRLQTVIQEEERVSQNLQKSTAVS
ncbi:Kinesin-like protein KIF2A [Trichoplax sp. H2]|nr:Kinesin-like protein KIF2A [Trichoplax sp. H2]|eukprot:RDD47829.1 Kinesin-like protein KIF2A [Trichoplax sp. H2]